MADEKIRVQIESEYEDRDAKKAIRDAEKIEDLKPELTIEADASGVTEVTDALDKVPSKAQEVAAAIVEMATKIDTETRDAAAAADALKLALGDAAERIDATEAVAELQRIGLTADEVRADADTLATALKSVDDLNLSRAKGELDSTGAKVRDVGSNADQSRSVLANMAGNAAQDMGELGGVVGTVGVGIGQLAEYATEGNIALRNLAGVAGPMAGIVAATALISSQLKNIQETKAFRADLVKDYAAAIKEAGASTETLGNEITEAGQLLARVGQDNPMGRLFNREETIDVVNMLADAGVTLGDVTRLYDEFVAAQDAGADTTEHMESALRELGVPADDINDVMLALADNFGTFQTAAADAESSAKFFASSLTDINQVIDDNAFSVATTDAAWTDLLADFKDGNIDTERGVTLWNLLRRELDLTDPAMRALAEQKLDEQIAATGDAAEEAAAQILEVRDAVKAMSDNVDEAEQVMSSADWGAADLRGATAAYDEYRQHVTGDRQQVADTEAAWDGLGTAIESAGEHVTDLGSPEGRAVYAALDELGSTIVPDLAQAFADSDGDIGTFRRSTDRLARDTLTRLQREFNLSEEDAAALFAELGLMPEQLTTFYELAGDEDAVIETRIAARCH